MAAIGHKRRSAGTVRVFVSSTFGDLSAERDHLIVAVYPELEERLARLDLTFFDTDLRWGVPRREQQDTEAESIWDYCRRCIAEASPLFVCLLGHRYGSLAPEEQLRGDERRRWRNLSMTELEVRYALRNMRRARLRPLFFLRNTVPPPETAPRLRDADLTRIEKLRDDISSHFDAVHYSCECTGDTFTGLDPFGQEALELMWSAVLRSKEFVPASRWRPVFTRHPGSRRLLSGAAPIPKAYWEALIAHRPKMSLLQRERQAQQSFIDERLRWYYGGDVEHAALTAFVQDNAPDAPRFCLIAATPGAGKTSLLARFSLNRPANEICVAHFVGAIERSASERDLLMRIGEELAAAGLMRAPPTGDIKALRDRFTNFLASYNGHKKLVIIVDGVNQLSADGQTAWIPHVLSSKVRLIISCAMEPGASALIAAMRDRHAKRIDLQPLSADSIRNIARDYFADYGKTLEPALLDEIASMPGARSPLYLITLLSELREIPGSTPFDDRLQLLNSAKADLTTSVALFRHRLRRLEVFGHIELRAWCQALLVSRAGFSAQQLAAIVSQAGGAGAAAHRIRRALRRVLLMRGLQSDFYHGELRAAAHAEYPIEDHPALHRMLATALTPLAEGGDQFALAQLVFHWVEAKDWKTALSILENEDEIIRRLTGSEAAYRLCLEFDSAYRAALDDGAQNEAQRIVDAFLSALASARVRAHGLNIRLANAWLSYGQGHRFIRATLEAGANLPPANADVERLSLDCRGILAGLVRREQRLEDAELMLQPITTHPRTGTIGRALEHLSSLTPAKDADQGQRDGRNAYEIAYVHFLRGDLLLARLWFLHSARLSRRGRDSVGAAISSCLAANCDFISQRRAPRLMRAALMRANRVFQAHAAKGDPNADRWTWNVASHLFETAFAEKDAALARRYYDAIVAHTWPARYGYTGGKSAGDQMSVNAGLLTPHRARLAMLEGQHDEAVTLFESCFQHIDLSATDRSEATARIALDFGDALVMAGQTARALEIWRQAMQLPAQRGNVPWQTQIAQRISKFVEA